jgi:hypothetical protein
MPRYVAELTQGNSFSRSSDGGGLAESAVRKWRVLLDNPNETWDIFATVGVSIGDLYGDINPIPCVSVSSQMEGDSRLVAIVTAEYRTSPSSSPSGVDPKSQEPSVRPALYSMSSSLCEIAAWSGKKVTGNSSGSWVPACNPVGDMYDGVTRLEPVITINIDQYSASDESAMLTYSGYVNQSAFSFSSLSIDTHCCMLQGVSSTPVVEQFGTSIFRGFKVTFQFALRSHWTFVDGGFKAIGWDSALPQTGFNIINTGLGNSAVDDTALMLQHQDGRVKVPYELAAGFQGRKVRGNVPIPFGDGGGCQRPCAQPIPLNDNGTPRNVNNYGPLDKVLVYRVCMQPEMNFGNNFSAFGIRLG